MLWPAPRIESRNPFFRRWAMIISNSLSLSARASLAPNPLLFAPTVLLRPSLLPVTVSESLQGMLILFRVFRLLRLFRFRLFPLFSFSSSFLSVSDVGETTGK